MLASSLLVSPNLAAEYAAVPIRNEAKKCFNLSLANYSSFLVEAGGLDP